MKLQDWITVSSGSFQRDQILTESMQVLSRLKVALTNSYPKPHELETVERLSAQFRDANLQFTDQPTNLFTQREWKSRRFMARVSFTVNLFGFWCGATSQTPYVFIAALVNILFIGYFYTRLWQVWNRGVLDDE